MLSRRQLLQGLAVTAGGSAGVAGYAIAEPLTLDVKTYRLTPTQWPAGFHLRLALLTDFHACDPWMSPDRIATIVARTNALMPDVVLLLGDYAPGAGMLRFARPVPHREWASALAGLKAPFGVHAVLGNHDWWDDTRARVLRGAMPLAGVALEAAGIPVYENRVSRHVKNGQPFWIAGLGDQLAHLPRKAATQLLGQAGHGSDDLAGTLRRITDAAPVILMAHEPDIFPRVPRRVALTVCGHTHGGQVRLPGVTPYVPSRYGTRFIYGHVVENRNHMIVSSGLGCSGVPVRFGMPPEIVIVELGSWSAVAHS